MRAGDGHDPFEGIHHRFCVHTGLSSGLAVAAIRGWRFAAGTLEHVAGPAAQCTRGDLPGILGWCVGHRAVGPDPRFARRWLLGQGPRDRCAGPEPRRMVRSDANQGHGLRWRLEFEDHLRRLAAERRLGTRRRAADAAALFLSRAYRAMDEGGAMNKFVIRFG